MLKPVSIFLLVSLAAWPSLASARGGGHFGGAGLHGGYGGREHGLEHGLGGGVGRGVRLPGNRRMNRPAMEAGSFAAIEMTQGADLATLPGLTEKLTESLTQFNGRIIANDTSPGPVDGVSPTSFTLVAFGTSDDMEHWKTSEPFKAFETDAQKAGARIFTVDAVPSPPIAEREDPRRVRENQAYQQLIEGADRTLKKIQDICSHC
jgi:hypothetical protein